VDFGCPTVAPIQWPDELLVYDNCGRLTTIKCVIKDNSQSGSYNISKLPSGLYFLTLFGRKIRFVCY